MEKKRQVMVMGAPILPPMLRLDILSGPRLEHVRSTAVVIYLPARAELGSAEAGESGAALSRC